MAPIQVIAQEKKKEKKKKKSCSGNCWCLHMYLGQLSKIWVVVRNKSYKKYLHEISGIDGVFVQNIHSLLIAEHPVCIYVCMYAF